MDNRETFLSRFCENYDDVDYIYYEKQYLFDVLADKGFDFQDVDDIETLDEAITTFIASQLFVLVSNCLFVSDEDLGAILENVDNDWLENLVSIQSWNIVYLNIENFKSLAQDILEEANVKFTECEYDPHYISYICTRELRGLFCEVNE